MTHPILDIAIRDLAEARLRLDGLKREAVRPDLREAWAMVALRLARRLIATDAATARSILEEVRHVAMAHPGEPGLARAWADAAGPTVAHLAAVDVEAACGLLDTFEDLARRQPREPKLRERWAAGTEAVIAHLAVADPVRAQSLQRKLEG